jgi:hypothetical protein
MRYSVFLIILVLFFAFDSNAQSSHLAPSTFVAAADNMVSSEAVSPAFASVTLVPAENLPPLLEATPAGASTPAPSPQRDVISATLRYGYQAYLGYTFVRVYAFPAREVNRNGLDVGMTYFYKTGIFGLDGAITGAFGSIGNETSNFAFVGGGPRVRTTGPRGIEVWAHGLLGVAHFGPRLAGFSQNAFAYELGGGVDIPSHLRRIYYRVEADMIASRFYDTGQYSPKVSAGIVFRF